MASAPAIWLPHRTVARAGIDREEAKAYTAALFGSGRLPAKWGAKSLANYTKAVDAIDRDRDAESAVAGLFVAEYYRLLYQRGYASSPTIEEMAHSAQVRSK